MPPRADNLSQHNGASFNTVSSGIDAEALAKASADTIMLESQISRYSFADKDGRMPETQPYQAVFEQELYRVVQFFDFCQRELEFSAKSLLTNAEVTSEQVSQRKDGHDMIHSISQKMEDLVESCLELQNFVTKNRTALLQVAQKADARLKTHCSQLVVNSLTTNLNSVIAVVASDIYSTIRSTEKKLNSEIDVIEEDGVWKAPSSFQRSTTKYWVKEENLTRLLLACASEAPLLVYGKKGILTPKSNRLSKVSEGDKLWTSMVTPITSVYFDSPDMAMYKKRLARVEGAQLLRARWYGNKMPTGDGIIFLELKTHHEKWVANKSVKERAAVQERDMRYFLQPSPWSGAEAKSMILRASPTLTADELTKASNLLFRMHKLVVKHKLQSCVRSVYLRAAFQSAKSNDLRLTLDRNVTMIDETSRVDTLGKSWCLSDEEAKKHTKAAVVPFNVFEVKLVGDNPMPQGLASCISTGVIEEAPKFSKFLTGAAVFNRVSTLPYWASHPAFADMFGMTKALDQKDPDQYTSLADPCDCYHLFGGSGGDGVFNESQVPRKRGILGKFLPPEVTGGVKIAEKKPVKVEPKSFFANERTFIQWLSAALLLLTVSTIMMGNGDYLRTAALISFSAFFLVIYASFTYFRRIKLLSTGKGYGYVDHFGPTILAVGVGIGVFIVFWDILGASDILGKSTRYEGDRRLVTSWNNPRQLLTISGPTAMQEERGLCVNHRLSGINTLTYEPNDAIIHKGMFLVAAPSEIVEHNLFGDSEARHWLHLDNTELGGLTATLDSIFALSAGPVRTELIEFAFTKNGSLESKGRWIVSEEKATTINGLTFVPRSYDDNKNGHLFIGVNGSIRVYEVPKHGDPSLTLVETVNMKMIHQGMHRGDKIASMHTFEGVTYLLSACELRAWDFNSGEFLGTVALPCAEGTAPMQGEWKGITFERKEEIDTMTALRGANRPTQLWMHITLDAPPQIWSFAVEETSRGRFSLPHCAAVASSTNSIDRHQ